MLPIRVSQDSGINEEEEAFIMMGVMEALTCLKYSGKVEVFGNSPWCEGEYSSADWYVDQARRLRRSNGNIQLDVEEVVGLMKNNPQQETKPYVDVMFVSRDLTILDGEKYRSFVFGMIDGRFMVQSVARFREIPNDLDRHLALKTITQHELGHLFKMAASSDRSNTENKVGPHCTNYGCVMRRALTVPDWVQNARESCQAEMVYCPQCLEDARKRIQKEEIWGI